jgi:hypothetical protein
VATQPNNTVRSLVNNRIDTKQLPVFTIPPIPDKVAKAFPDLVSWQQATQRAFTEYNQKLTLAVNGGVS